MGDRWGGGGGLQWATRARWVAHRGKKKMAFHSHGVGVGVGVPWEGQPANNWRKNRDTEGDRGCTQACSREGGAVLYATGCTTRCVVLDVKEGQG